MDLSILIPARNEEFLPQTVEDILKNMGGDTEIIVVLDGYHVDLPPHPRLRVIHNETAVGQRAATNQACRLSEAKYVMKTDAHCAFDKGFDVKMMNDMQPDWTMVPTMRNLHVFNWVCPDGHSRYQGPSGPCKECGKETTKDIVWIPKKSPQSNAYRFDNTLHFQYWKEYEKKQVGDLCESMSIQGSCFLLTREKYWELDICDEAHGSWGQQGVEVACKTWLSGGKVIINKKTWYAHLFRTQGGDFGFPYPNPGVHKAREYSRELWFKNKWPKAKYPLDWLIKKFNPPGWDKTKGVLYYTDNQLPEHLMKACQEQITKGIGNAKLVSVSLKPLDFGQNIVLDMERSYKTMFKQILTGLEALDTDIVYFAEHDVLYHPDHFAFTPSDPNKFYYNGHYWNLRLSDGFAVHYDVSPLSGLVAYREALITHFKERIQMIEEKGFGLYMGFEPMTHRRVKWKNWYDFEVFVPENPNVDLAHGGNLTRKRWSTDKFIRKPKFWNESDIDHIPGWNDLRVLMK